MLSDEVASILSNDKTQQNQKMEWSSLDKFYFNSTNSSLNCFKTTKIDFKELVKQPGIDPSLLGTCNTHIQKILPALKKRGNDTLRVMYMKRYQAENSIRFKSFFTEYQLDDCTTLQRKGDIKLESKV